MLYLVLALLATRLIPVFILEGYLWRSYLIPRNKYFNIYLHIFVGSDERVPHDHPWPSWSLCLWGRIREYIQDPWYNVTCRQVKIGDTVARPATWRHYLVLDSKFAVTLFITGRVNNDHMWYFYPKSGDRVKYYDWPNGPLTSRWDWLGLRWVKA